MSSSGFHDLAGRLSISYSFDGKEIINWNQMAFIDILLTVMVALYISRNMSLPKKWLTIFILFVMGILAHSLFGVDNTKIKF